ncbi:unnamed protein product [Rotaria sp. Silwood2]|nr:unnamed protein product [Rotaria sp. Silwood2]CAF4226788.1 unnamed protein product [Rotaria sp. Silwood2]
MVITSVSNIPISQSLSLVGDPEIQRIRKFLLIAIAILLAFSLVSIITVISGKRIEDGIKEIHGGVQFGQSIILLFFYIFGIFVVYRYYETGLRVFGWLGTIIMIIMAILIVVLLFVGIAASATKDLDNDNDNKNPMTAVSMGIFVTVLSSIARLILTIIIIIFAFKLAKLIDVKRSLAIQQPNVWFTH